MKSDEIIERPLTSRSRKNLHLRVYHGTLVDSKLIAFYVSILHEKFLLHLKIHKLILMHLHAKINESNIKRIGKMLIPLNNELSLIDT